MNVVVGTVVRAGLKPAPTPLPMNVVSNIVVVGVEIRCPLSRAGLKPAPTPLWF